ncbi:hypothetical protein T310_8907, partial [Rasamsonia emersonii CBS 393.64]
VYVQYVIQRPLPPSLYLGLDIRSTSIIPGNRIPFFYATTKRRTYRALTCFDTYRPLSCRPTRMGGFRREREGVCKPLESYYWAKKGSSVSRLGT